MAQGDASGKTKPKNAPRQDFRQRLYSLSQNALSCKGKNIDSTAVHHLPEDGLQTHRLQNCEASRGIAFVRFGLMGQMAEANGRGRWQPIRRWWGRMPHRLPVCWERGCQIAWTCSSSSRTQGRNGYRRYWPRGPKWMNGLREWQVMMLVRERTRVEHWSRSVHCRAATRAMSDMAHVTRVSISTPHLCLQRNRCTRSACANTFWGR